MKVFYSTADWNFFFEEENIASLGFVPTMGALHDGHLSLIKGSQKDNKYTICSLFVNPTQFNNPNDLEKYPRNLEKDLDKLKEVNCDFVFVPSIEDVYPNGLQTENIDLNGLDQEMEGAYRPRHFDGVATVVKKLFTIIKPNKAYLGEKDFQQFQIIKQMTKSEKLAVEIIAMPIVREINGLAMSSRNERLTKFHRENAKVIYETLCYVKNNFTTETVEYLSDYVEKVFKKTDFILEYFLIVDEKTLKPMKEKNKNVSYRAFIACFADEVRLIDNMSLS